MSRKNDLRDKFSEEELAEVHNALKTFHQEDPAKLKEHLELFNDAVIAIISTIMVLEIPLPTAGNVSYGTFVWSFLIFIVSFFIVGNFWYQHHNTMSHLNAAKKSTLIMNFLFLGTLSLIPLMTKWIMQEPTSLAIANYGVVYLVINLLENFMFALLQEEIWDKNRQILIFTQRFSIIRVGVLLVWNLILIGLAFVPPKLVMIFYLSLPIISFLTPSDSLNKQKRIQKRQKVRKTLHPTKLG